MFKVAVIFFIMGVLGLFLGILGVGGLTIELGEMIISLFFIFALISFIGCSESETESFRIGQ